MKNIKPINLKINDIVFRTIHTDCTEDPESTRDEDYYVVESYCKDVVVDIHKNIHDIHIVFKSSPRIVLNLDGTINYERNFYNSPILTRLIEKNEAFKEELFFLNKNDLIEHISNNILF
jgi:hypothetical protein